MEGLVTVEGAATGTALICVDAEGRNQIAVAPGANHALVRGGAGAPCRSARRGRRSWSASSSSRSPWSSWALAEARRGGRADHPEPRARAGSRRGAASTSSTTSRPTRARRAGSTGVEVTDPSSARAGGGAAPRAGRGHRHRDPRGPRARSVCGGEGPGALSRFRGDRGGHHRGGRRLQRRARRRARRRRHPRAGAAAGECGGGADVREPGRPGLAAGPRATWSASWRRSAVSGPSLARRDARAQRRRRA